MMHKKIVDSIVDSLNKATGEKLDSLDIKDSRVSDFSSSIAFKLAGEGGVNPGEKAQEIAGKLDVDAIYGIGRIEVLNGYVNFFLDYERLTPLLLDVIRKQGESYGRGEDGKERIILEHTSINPSGPVHVGRLRNSLIGDSLARILRFYGFDVETHYYVNDVGKQVAMIAQASFEDVEPEGEVLDRYRKYMGKKDFKVFAEYVSANRLFEDDDGFKTRVQDLIKRAESGDAEALEAMKKKAGDCLEGQMVLFDRLGIGFDVFDYESDLIRDGRVREVVDFLKGVEYAKESGAGLGLDLSGFGIEKRGGVSVLLRRDGTSVYLARDVAYHLHKAGLGGRLVNVLGEDHKLEFREVDTILGEIYGISKSLKAVHYSFVSFEGLELSTRRGQTAPVDLLLDDAVGKAEHEITVRGVALRDVAPLIGVGAVKYHILKAAPSKPINFSWSEALNFDGDSAPYIQYAHARCCSILEKSGLRLEDAGLDGLRGLDELEEKLVFMLLCFPDVVEKAAVGYKPNLVSSFIYELASVFSRFYRECPVLNAEDDIRLRRLLLVDAVRQVLCSGLFLLGIEAPVRM